jgi:hypothetical protein
VIGMEKPFIIGVVVLDSFFTTTVTVVIFIIVFTVSEFVRRCTFTVIVVIRNAMG